MRIPFLVAALALTGCASQIMDGFVGKEVTDVQLQYGPPVNVMDMPDGRKAFQWRQNSAMMLPTTTSYTGYATGNIFNATAMTYGGGIFETTCYYTLFAEPNSKKSFTVVGFQKPSIDCE